MVFLDSHADAELYNVSVGLGSSSPPPAGVRLAVAPDLGVLGNVVSIAAIDEREEALGRLGDHWAGGFYVGHGMDTEILRKAGIERAGGFAATTNGDNTNIMSAQIVKIKFKVARVVARIYDPLRAEAYKELGIDTISPTLLGAGMCRDFLMGLPYRSVDEYQAARVTLLRPPAPEGSR